MFFIVFSPSDNEWRATNILNEKDLKNTAQYTKRVFDCLSEVRREYQRMPVPVAVTGGERQLQQQLREKEEQVRG